jgi:hypothetical protein
VAFEGSGGRLRTWWLICMEWYLRSRVGAVKRVRFLYLEFSADGTAEIPMQALQRADAREMKYHN